MGSVTILDKSDVLSGLFGTWDSLDALLSGLSEQQWQTPTPLPGWCVHNVVAHIVGTESVLQGLSYPDADFDASTLDHVRNDVGVANEAWVRHLSTESGPQLLEGFRSIAADRRQRLNDMSIDDWNAPTPTPVGLESFGRFMRVRLFDCWMHEQDIRDGVSLPGHGAGPAAEISIDEIVLALGYIVGKRAAVGPGSLVHFSLTGPVERDVWVAVSERAAVVDDPGRPATTTLRLGSGLFARLAGGRTDAESHLGEVGIEGDVELGQRVLASLKFTI